MPTVTYGHPLAQRSPLSVFFSVALTIIPALKNFPFAKKEFCYILHQKNMKPKGSMQYNHATAISLGCHSKPNY